MQTLKVSVPGRITQLHIAPQGDFLVVLTATNTAHVVLLPSSDRFTSSDTNALRPKVWQLGPTLHVRERSPIASCIWHPLGTEGHALITITEDAILRLWELNTNDRKSFEDPALSFDLKKLANATSAEENLRASKYGAGLEFTPDIFEMEVAAACFGGNGYSGEAPWAPMTLWIAMKTGDIYALSPLLPSRWQPPPGLVQDLATQVRANQLQLADAHSGTSDLERFTIQAQLKWIEDVEGQDPVIPSTQSVFEGSEVYKRPSKPSAVPRLQGPFSITPDADTDFELTDIFVVGLKGNSLDDVSEDEFDELATTSVDQPMSGGVVCLLTSNARVLICLDLDGVEAQWLPSKSATRRQSVFEMEQPIQDLLLIDTVSLTEMSEVQFCTPAITPDIRARPAFFITHDKGISYVSLDELLSLLRDELSIDEADLSSDSPAGVGFRTSMLLQDSKITVEKPLKFSTSEGDTKVLPNLATAITLEDSDIGYFLLTTADNLPFACTLDLPLSDLKFDLDNLALDESNTTADRLASEGPPFDDPQPAYQPAEAFYRKSQYPKFLASHIPDRHRRVLGEEIKLSPAAFDIFYHSHKTIDVETEELQKGVAELFRRVERMQDEWRDVVRRAAELNSRVDAIVGDDDIDYEPEEGQDDDEEDKILGRTKERIDGRMERVQHRQHELSEQYERVMAKVRRAKSKELSDKERAWGEEVTSTMHDLGGADNSSETNGEAAKSRLKQRLDEVQRLKNELVAQAKKVAEQQDDESNAGTFKVPEGLRKRGIERVMELLERETALVEAVGDRVERLTAGMAAT